MMAEVERSNIPEQYEKVGSNMDEDKTKTNDMCYIKYWKAYYENYILVKQLSKAVSDNIFLEEAVKDINKPEVFNATDSNNDKKGKRHRRLANEIVRHYQCPAPEWRKSYGSEGSLNQHVKLKHKEYYETYKKGIVEK